MLAVSTSVSVGIINIHYKGEYGCRVPKILRKILLRWVAQYVGLSELANKIQDEDNEVNRFSRKQH